MTVKQAVLLFISILVIYVLNSNANESFLKPPKIIQNPGEQYSGKNRQFQGIPSLAVASNGRLWATWYAGPTPAEDQNNYVVLSTSGDHGKTWKEVIAIDPDGNGPVRAFDPEIWIDPTGRLWAFWAQTIGHTGTIAGVWSMTTKNPNSENPEWSAPRRLTDGIMMCKPTVLTTGEWILPASTWRETDNSARVVISTDAGHTWKVRGAAHVPEGYRNFDEHMIVEKKDGTLWMLVRTTYGIGQSFSPDRGQTWSPLKPSGIPHPAARFFIRRLQSGNILLVKHGPMDEKTGRSHLTAFISKDDGQTWTGGLLLDRRKGVSYPDGQQDSTEKIHIIYDYSRTEEMKILLATFRENDIFNGNQDSDTVNLRIQVNKAQGPN